MTLSVKETEHDYIVEAAPLSQPERCPRCGGVPEQLHRHGTRRQFVKDTPVRGKRVRIYFARRRYKCLKCRKTFRQPLDGVNERRGCTERLVRYAEREALRKPFVTVADDVGVSDTTVRGIFTDFAEHLTETVRFETPRLMGLDEVYVARTARCIITDLARRRVFDLLPKRDMLTLTRYLIQLPDKERVEAISIDMWRPFYSVVRATLPGARIVIDTYHVQRMANQAVMSALRAVRSRMTAKERRECLFSRFILLKRGYSLSEREKATLASWKRKVPEIGAAYELKEEFLAFWKLSSRREAEARFEVWRKGVPTGLHYAFKDLLVALKNWHDEIFNYFDLRITNAFTESANNVVKGIQRQGRTYSYEIVRAKMLYGGAFVVRRPPHPLDERGKRAARAGKESVGQRRRARREPSSQSPRSAVARLKRAREARDIFNELLRPPERLIAHLGRHPDTPDEPS
jgi:transposase